MAAFEAGDLALLVDRKGRRYLVKLVAGQQFHTHTGVVAHDDIISLAEGAVVRSGGSGRFMAYRPTLSDYILKMPRGAQVIYPKDIGAVLMFADIAPGQKILETGVGSGALSLALLRLGAEVTGYDISHKFAERARANVANFLGAEALEHYQVKIQDSYEGIAEGGFDRMLLDLPEPWRLVPYMSEVMRPGGIALAYSPSIIQVSRFRQACAEAEFTSTDTIEVLQRGWHVQGQAVRPDHRMVAHTGFLTRVRVFSADS